MIFKLIAKCAGSRQYCRHTKSPGYFKTLFKWNLRVQRGQRKFGPDGVWGHDLQIGSTDALPTELRGKHGSRSGLYSLFDYMFLQRSQPSKKKVRYLFDCRSMASEPVSWRWTRLICLATVASTRNAWSIAVIVFTKKVFLSLVNLSTQDIYLVQFNSSYL